MKVSGINILFASNEQKYYLHLKNSKNNSVNKQDENISINNELRTYQNIGFNVNKVADNSYVIYKKNGKLN